MTWADLGEFVKAVAPAFTAGAACFAAWIAYKGLTRWQTEVLGRRRMALFGPKVAEPFDEIEQTLSKIIAAARMLLRTAGDEIRDVEFHRKLEATIWQAEENDEHATKVDKAVTDIEAICRPVLEKRAA